MNTLYSVLSEGVQTTEGERFAKRKSTVLVSDKCRTLRDVILYGIPQSSILKAACIICTEAMHSEYAFEIRALDPVNTYTMDLKISDADEHATTDAGTLFMSTERYLQAGRKYLDDDIKSSLVCPSLFDVLSALSLQLLRETAK